MDRNADRGEEGEERIWEGKRSDSLAKLFLLARAPAKNSSPLQRFPSKKVPKKDPPGNTVLS